MLRIVHPLIVAVMVLSTSACVPLQAPPGSVAPVESRQPGQASPRENQGELVPKKIAPARQTVSPAQRAVSALLQEGWGYYRLENFQRSIEIAERAQRLDPRRAEVYLLLASSYFVQNQGVLAEHLAQRGLSLSQGEATIRHQLQVLLVKIHGTVL